MKRLENKAAVIYGNGAVGTTVAKAFAKEGAMVYLTGTTLSKLEAAARIIHAEGGLIEIAVVDAMNEAAVEKHMSEVVNRSGRIDISFNAVGLSQTAHQGTALTELSLENFLKPITTYSQSHFITARAAAKRMIQQKHGVILMNTPSPSRISVPFMGGMPSTWSAIEALSRTISAECGPYGVRSVCILTSAMPDTPLIDEVYDLHAKAHGIDYNQFLLGMESRTHTKRLTSINDLATAAVFAASDEGRSLTGTILNLTAGLVIN
ncbi:SDR family NAD(P)-dependent oxidoreductase [Longitalea luteola]|uniref:SDR family NAD(P)-dependent oxidoreductase n=1 Tax=Longitalea luteola TaxID=2812563 RepID=UPI001A95DB7C|nr:SDR family oxidoreductase [Longitalea luteola]